MNTLHFFWCSLIGILLISCSKENIDSKDNPFEPKDIVPNTTERIPCISPIPTNQPYAIDFDYNIQREIIPEEHVLDCSMVPIGSPRAEGFDIIRDPSMPYHGKPSYFFRMSDNSKKRVEMQNLYVTQADLDQAGVTAQEILDHQAVKSLYHFGKGEVKKGETATYEYGIYLPKELKEMSGIITQWHGMPDRTTVVTPAKDTIFIPHDTFVKDYLSVMYFDGSIGKDKSNDQPNGYVLDSGGNPPMALRVRNGYLYLICRIDRARVTNNQGERVHIYPPNNFPPSLDSPEGNKTVYGLYKEKLDDLPLEEWIDMKFVVRWSNFAEDGSGVLDDGNVKMFMNNQLKVDWTGTIGNNDAHGTYFKFGLYVPMENGLVIRCADFKQKIN